MVSYLRDEFAQNAGILYACLTSPCVYDGDLILLEQQDRSLWNRDQIAEGISLTESALRSRRFGAYTLQAAIAAVHAESPSGASTDWRQITLLYDQLLRVQPSPVVELNRAVAVAMCEGLEQGLALIDDLLAREHLSPPGALGPRGYVPPIRANPRGPCFL
jgi:predicted RNA polymerase sigma factor